MGRLTEHLSYELSIRCHERSLEWRICRTEVVAGGCQSRVIAGDYNSPTLAWHRSAHDASEGPACEPGHFCKERVDAAFELANCPLAKL